MILSDRDIRRHLQDKTLVVKNGKFLDPESVHQEIWKIVESVLTDEN